MAKLRLTPEERELRRENWLAPAGSLQERRYLEKLARQPGLTDEERARVYELLKNADSPGKRNKLFWHAAKKSVLGPCIYDIARERHKKLGPDEWLVACLTAEGIDQTEIAIMMGKSDSTIQKKINSIKETIKKDFRNDVEVEKLAQIARWFLGL